VKTKLETLNVLHQEGRWDIDYHLPPEGVKEFSSKILKPISEAADIVKDKRDPTKESEKQFFYVDISCVDVVTGSIALPQDLVGSEAPSRARKIIQAYDIIISTCRPTRGAIAVIPEKYHDQICSTGFSVIRPKKGINPFYLHFAIRLSSTLEQFRKFSTGSSYPAILDSDVEKTLIPLPDKSTQDLIAAHILNGLSVRRKSIEQANELFDININAVIKSLSSRKYKELNPEFDEHIYKSDEIKDKIESLNTDF
jgi:type I restriction enzyme S subunit